MKNPTDLKSIGSAFLKVCNGSYDENVVPVR